MYLLRTPPESVFPHGIFIPYSTEDEALDQAAWDMQESDNIEGVYYVPDGKHLEYTDDIPASALINAWASGMPITKDVVPYRPSKKLEKIVKASELKKKVAGRMERMVGESLEAQADSLLAVHRGIKRGDLPLASVPSAAYTVVTGGTATGGAVALAAATAKTVIGIASISAGTAGQPPSITEVAFSFDGVTASAVPVLVESVSGTNATNPPGTASTAMTLKQIRGWPANPAASTAAYNWTTEPTVLEVYKKRLLTPNGGLLVIQYPLGREPTGIVTAATQFKFIGFRLTAPAAVNTHSDMEIEE